MLFTFWWGNYCAITEKLTMLFIMQSVNRPTMKISSSNINFPMIFLPIGPSALCFSMSDFTGSSNFWIRVSLQLSLYACFLVGKQLLCLHSSKPPFSFELEKQLSLVIPCLLKRSRTLGYILALSLDCIILVALRKRYCIIASS